MQVARFNKTVDCDTLGWKARTAQRIDNLNVNNTNKHTILDTYFVKKNIEYL